MHRQSCELGPLHQIPIKEDLERRALKIKKKIKKTLWKICICRWSPWHTLKLTYPLRTKFHDPSPHTHPCFSVHIQIPHSNFAQWPTKPKYSLFFTRSVYFLNCLFLCLHSHFCKIQTLSLDTECLFPYKLKFDEGISKQNSGMVREAVGEGAKPVRNCPSGRERTRDWATRQFISDWERCDP